MYKNTIYLKHAIKGKDTISFNGATRITEILKDMTDWESGMFQLEADKSLNGEAFIIPFANILFVMDEIVDKEV